MRGGEEESIYRFIGFTSTSSNRPGGGGGEEEARGSGRLIRKKGEEGRRKMGV